MILVQCGNVPIVCAGVLETEFVVGLLLIEGCCSRLNNYGKTNSFHIFKQNDSVSGTTSSA